MGSILVKNGTVIDPSQHLEAPADVLIRDGKVAACGKMQAQAERVIDASGLYVVPGLIDMHVHLREPGQEEEETIASGAAAALAGGFTTLACMPNTEPAIDNEAAVEFVLRQAARAGQANVLPMGALTKGRQGSELAEMGQMTRAGAIAFTDDGSGVANPAVMLRAMQYAVMLGRPVAQHCEDAALTSGASMNSGLTASMLGLGGWPPLAEELMLYRDIQLARSTGARYHVQHVTTAGAAGLIRQALESGIAITAEVAPHHLLLTEDCCRDYDANYKVNPPLRTQTDIAALKEGVRDGVIGILASDHAPHLASEKQLEFDNAPFGMIGMESALPLYVRALVDGDVLNWSGLIERMTINPARALGIDKGTLRVGADADVTLIDPHREWQIDVERFRSKSRNCPFHGWQVRGKAVGAIVGGELKYEDGLKIAASEAAAAT